MLPFRHPLVTRVEADGLLSPVAAIAVPFVLFLLLAARMNGFCKARILGAWETLTLIGGGSKETQLNEALDSSGPESRNR